MSRNVCASNRVVIYDTTLRDGAQTEGISFSAEDKVEVLKRLDSFGIPFVEGGWPGSSPRDDEFFAKAEGIGLRNTRLVAFGSTRRHGVPPEEDPNLLALSGCGAEWCCIFGKTWDFQVTDALRIPLDENVRMISDSIRFLRSCGKRVMFDAEHYFDGYVSNKDYALRCVKAAEEAGAEYVVLCDTNGGRLPEEVHRIVLETSGSLGAKLGVHCHNDCELAVANSLAAVSAGAVMVQGTVNGLGERCGNANLTSLIPDLVLKAGYDVGIGDLSGLTDIARFVAETANVPVPDQLPYAGSRAFAHKGGMHISALVRDTRTYEHVPPESVGNTRRLLVSDMAGRASIGRKLSDMGIEADADVCARITGKVKELESGGYDFEGADASFELLARKVLGGFVPPFRIEGFRVFMDGEVSEATVKVCGTDGRTVHTAADGNGPVNALDNAVRKALSDIFPEIEGIRLTDYKVRVIDGRSATAASVRVLIRSTDGHRTWTTVGVSENVVEASVRALEDSLGYAVFHSEHRS